MDCHQFWPLSDAGLWNSPWTSDEQSEAARWISLIVRVVVDPGAAGVAGEWRRLRNRGNELLLGIGSHQERPTHITHRARHGALQRLQQEKGLT